MRRLRRSQMPVPKINGADVELGGFMTGAAHGEHTGYDAAKAVLKEIRGVPCRRDGGTAPGETDTVWDSEGCLHDDAWVARTVPPAEIPERGTVPDIGTVPIRGGDPRDVGRRFLSTNGGCVYIDLAHLELCIPEVTSAFDHVAAWHAMLQIAREAMTRANDALPEGRRIHLFVNNSDGHGNSWGSHCNFLVSRPCFERMAHTKMHQMLYFASYLVSSIVFTGAGKAGSDRGPDVDYQISSRADFFECLTSTRTTTRRPIVNLRDESLCGPACSSFDRDGDTLDRDLARCHVIFFDATLAQVATLLKIGVTQIILAMAEQEYIQPHLILDDPLDALRRFSRDPDLRTKARLACGRELTAVEVQREMCRHATRFVEAGRADGVVPHAGKIVRAWQRTLTQLRERDWPALARKLDWVLKRCILERTIARTGLPWSAPEIRQLDHLYSSLDPAEGLVWAYEPVVEKVVPDARIVRLTVEPPDDTRAWLRARILREVDPEHIVGVDWDEIRFRFPPAGQSPSAGEGPSPGGSRDDGVDYTLSMHRPWGFTREHCQGVLDRAGSPLGLSQHEGRTMGGTVPTDEGGGE